MEHGFEIAQNNAFKDGIHLKNIDLTGISKREQYDKFIEEETEFRCAFREFTFTRKEKDKFHAIEEFCDMLQSALGMLQLEGITAEEVMERYPFHLEKLPFRPRVKGANK
jgi:phosphoribosyl-ATP pyrophosphohydrolase